MQTKALLVQLLHILILGVFLLYVGIVQPRNPWFYYCLILLGIVAVVYFSIHVVSEDKFWVLWHILVIGTVLLSAGAMGPHQPEFLYKLLIIIGSAAIGYHTVRLVQSLIKIDP